jgi:predicted N-acyltransferase
MKVSIHHSLRDLKPQDWDSLASGDFPFAAYDYLLAMETAGCVGEEAGWIPLYLTIHEGSRLSAATYLYVKTNSDGEFIFDFAWARAYHRHGLRYYPKLLSASPFTPVTGPKLLIHPEADAVQLAPALIAAALEENRRIGGSGLHFLYLDPKERIYFEQAGAMLRRNYQFRWHNQAYASFEEFLSGLKRKRRLQIARERRRVAELPLEIVTLSGEEIKPMDLAAMYEFYVVTFQKKFCTPYLTWKFFEEVYSRMRQNLVFIMAREEKRWVAGAIHYRKGQTLFGRYWGSFKEYANLHFELAYYRGIDYAIAHGLKEMDAGAGVPHKIFRGFDPEPIYSAHWIEHPQFKQAIADYIEAEDRQIQAELNYAAEHGSYKTAE